MYLQEAEAAAVERAAGRRAVYAAAPLAVGGEVVITPPCLFSVDKHYGNTYRVVHR